MFPQVVQRHWQGEVDNKSPFNSVLTQQHLCKKIPKSVNVRWSCSVLHHCRFFETRCSLYNSLYKPWCPGWFSNAIGYLIFRMTLLLLLGDSLWRTQHNVLRGIWLDFDRVDELRRRYIGEIASAQENTDATVWRDESESRQKTLNCPSISGHANIDLLLSQQQQPKTTVTSV